MTDQELKDIVAAVVAELEKSGVDFDYKADQAKDDDLVFVIRGTAPDYQGVTVTWKGLLDIITAQATQAKNDAETAKNAANTILEQVQSKGTDITNFVATSKTEIETQKNESVNAVKSVYQTDLNELKGDLDNKDKFLKDNITEDVISLEYTEINANVTNDGSITYSSAYRCRYIQVYKGFLYVINAEEVSKEKAVRIAFFDEKPKVGLTGEFIKVIGGDIKNYTYIPSRDGYIACGTYETNTLETFSCKTVLSVLKNNIDTNMNDVFGADIEINKSHLLKLNFTSSGTEFVSSSSYETYCFPVESGKTYEFNAHNNNSEGIIYLRQVFSDDTPASGVLGTFIKEYKMPPNTGISDYYTPTNNGYLSFSFYSTVLDLTLINHIEGLKGEIKKEINDKFLKVNSIYGEKLYYDSYSLISENTIVKSNTWTCVPHDGAEIKIKCPEDIIVKFIMRVSPYNTSTIDTEFVGDGCILKMPVGYNLYKIVVSYGHKSDNSYIQDNNRLTVLDLLKLVDNGGFSLTYIDNNVLVNNKDVEKTIMSIIGNGMAILSHTSDIHGDAIRYFNFMEMSKYLGVTCAINTGDWCAVNNGDGFEFLNSAIGKYSDVDTLICVGNHDVNSDSHSYTKYYKPHSDVYGYTLSEGKTYYYKDYSSEKIRIISLNIYEDGHIGYSCRISKEQIDWFINTLKNTPSEYGVVVIAHSSEKWIDSVDGYTKFYNEKATSDWCNTFSNITGNPISKIIDAFISKTSISDTYTQKVSVDGSETNEEVSYSADFSLVSSGVEFIAYLNGHKHVDMVGYLSGTTNIQLSLNIVRGAESTYYNSEDDIPRANGRGSCQDAFNIYAIDRENGTIRIARIGSNKTFKLTDRDYMIIPYR